MRAWGGIAGLQYALPSTWQPWQAAGLNLTRFVQARRGLESAKWAAEAAFPGGTVACSAAEKLAGHLTQQACSHAPCPAYLSACPPTFRRPGRPHLRSLPA